jgi:lauroyl/myristoyl acyltransferase
MKTYYLLRLASGLTRLIPVRTGYWLCSLIGGVIFYLNPGVREAVLDNLGHVLPNASKHERRKLARKAVRNAVKNYYDLVRLPYLDKNEVEHRVTVYGIEQLDNALALGRGVILIGGHIGNYSMAAQVAAARGYPMTIIAEDIHPPKLYDYINKLRSRFGLRLIKTGSSQVRQIYKLLRSGEGLMLAADRDVTGGGVPVEFFGELADLPPGPVTLALRLNTPLIPVHTMRLPNSSNVVYINPPMELERTGDRDRDVEVNMSKVVRFLEESILKAPDQWVTMQKIWDREPANEQQSAVSDQPELQQEATVTYQPPLDAGQEPVISGQSSRKG